MKIERILLADIGKNLSPMAHLSFNQKTRNMFGLTPFHSPKTKRSKSRKPILSRKIRKIYNFLQFYL